MIVRLGNLVVLLQFKGPALPAVLGVSFILFQMFFSDLLSHNAEQSAIPPQRH